MSCEREFCPFTGMDPEVHKFAHQWERDRDHPVDHPVDDGIDDVFEPFMDPRVLVRDQASMTLADLYEQDPVRQRCPVERDFGVWWMSGTFAYPRWRVTWIRDTGEFYALEQTGGDAQRSRVVILGRTPPGDDAASERALEGWGDAMNGPGGLEWAAERLRAVRV